MYRSELSSDIQYLPGVGPKRAALLKQELKVSTIGELLRVYPFRYIDRSSIVDIADIIPDTSYVQIQAKVIREALIAQGGAVKYARDLGGGASPDQKILFNTVKRLSVTVSDGTGSMELVFFRGLKYAWNKLAPGETFLIFGKPSVFGSSVNIVHPEIDNPVTEEDKEKGGVMTGVYPSTDKLKTAGITGKTMNKLMLSALRLCLPEVTETLPEYILKAKGLAGLDYALEKIHFPKNQYELAKAEARLKFEELFYLQLSLLKQKYVRSRSDKGIPMPKVGPAFNKCYENLPFALTGAQKRVIKEIRADMMSGSQMNRLLQGDVGSGKTMVAVLSALIAVGNGCQACIMAPTEVLSMQHYQNILKYLAPTGVKAALLTGSTKTSERKEIHEQLESGEIGVIVGTHALLEDNVIFHRLGLAIIDEQHRFGVEQRSKLWAKTSDGVPPHVLVMTATPIPRTLAMTLYGDLDVSVIDEMPPGRKPVQTILITENKRQALNKFLKDQIKRGRQVFVVYPLIFENEKLDYKNLETGYERIVSDFPFPEYKVAIVHGRQNNDVKKFNMDAFAAGRADILVSTTVIEVGVDVPNATVMVIESAERFGLSQLHQLRGRVGRGSDKSFCVLVRGDKVSRESLKRLELLCSTEDGFTLAEEDLKMRGPGDLEGTMQSGLPIELEIASIAKDGRILQEARDCAEKILREDPELSTPKNRLLLSELRKSKYTIKDYSKIS